MAYVFKIVATKPEGTLWVADAIQEIHQRYWKWVRNYPGVLSVAGHNLDENTFERIIIFKDKTTYESWLVDRSQNEDFIARAQHQDDNQITSTIETYEA